MAEKILINGEPDNKLSVLDRGLHYGDGLFETIAAHENNLLCWDDHISRLLSGCERLGLHKPDSKVLQQESSSLLKNTKQGVIKIILTRGEGGRGYVLPVKTSPTRIISHYPWPDHPIQNREEGINLRLCKLRYSQNPVLAGIKHLNRLEQVMARSEWNDIDIQEGLVMDQDDHIIEGTMSNVFYVKNGILYTPKLELSGIEGIIRKKILEISPELNIETYVKEISLDEISNADEIFISNSVIGIWPVKSFNEQKYQPGEISKKLMQKLIEKNMIVPTC